MPGIERDLRDLTHQRETQGDITNDELSVCEREREITLMRDNVTNIWRPNLQENSVPKGLEKQGKKNVPTGKKIRKF